MKIFKTYKYFRSVPPGHGEFPPESAGPNPAGVHDDVSPLRHRRPPLLAADPHNHQRRPGHRVQDQQQGRVDHSDWSRLSRYCALIS